MAAVARRRPSAGRDGRGAHITPRSAGRRRWHRTERQGPGSSAVNSNRSGLGLRPSAAAAAAEAPKGSAPGRTAATPTGATARRPPRPGTIAAPGRVQQRQQHRPTPRRDRPRRRRPSAPTWRMPCRRLSRHPASAPLGASWNCWQPISATRTRNIPNPHTRRAHGRAMAEFLAWCDRQGVPSIAAVQRHVAAWIELQQEQAAPTVKARLAALRPIITGRSAARPR